ANRAKETDRNPRPGEIRPDFLQGQKYLAVVCAWLPPWLNVDKPYLAAVKAERQVGARCQMGVIEPEPRRTWRKRDAANAMRRDEGRTLFRCTIQLCRHEMTDNMKLH